MDRHDAILLNALNVLVPRTAVGFKEALNIVGVETLMQASRVVLHRALPDLQRMKAGRDGQPPDNAAKFCQWLQDPALPTDAFAGVEYSVFGCGNLTLTPQLQRIIK
jgi:hypothetical protein